jgi:hypothetical protein
MRGNLAVKVIYGIYAVILVSSIVMTLYCIIHPEERYTLTPLNQTTALEIQHAFDNDDDAYMQRLLLQRLRYLKSVALQSVLVHFHIPKAGVG